MTITGIMMVMIFSRTQKKWKVPVALFVTVVDFIFLISNLYKLPHGGYWSLILASLPLAAILIWTKGQRALYKALRPLDMETYLMSYEQIYRKGHISGTGLFFVKEWNTIPPYLVHCTIRSNIIYERNVLISIIRTDEPYGMESSLTPGLGTGLDAFEIRAGYMEMFDIEQLLKDNGILEKVIFYGIEDIAQRRGNCYLQLRRHIQDCTQHTIRF